MTLTFHGSGPLGSNEIRRALFAKLGTSSLCETDARPRRNFMLTRVTLPLVLCLVSLRLAVGQNRAVISAGSVISPDVRLEVEQVLRRQQEAWNRHDLEGFMTGYWSSPELTFFSGAHEARGWKGALDRYRRTYQSE